MTTNTHTHRLEALEQRVDQLEEQVSVSDPKGNAATIGGLMEIGLTRRQALQAMAYVLGGATIGGAVVASVVQVARADDPTGDLYGIDRLGIPEQPINEIHVNELFQSLDHVVADRLTVNDSELALNETPTSPQEGDVRIVEDS